MEDSISLRCPECGEPVENGKTECPRGHPVFPGLDDPTDLWTGATPPAEGSSEGSTRETTGETTGEDGGDRSPRTAPARKAFVNPLYECCKCNRLVETQMFHERAIVPRFCPWCGKLVSSILGREIDGYRVDEVISHGGFGIIYLASNIAQPAMKAAIKFLRPELVYSRPELIKIFIEEARLTEAIGQTCWNIVRISNVRERPWPSFFMEYVRGPTIERFVEGHRSQKIPLADCKGFLRGIARGLAATHRHGRIHRDLKPLNIMVIRSKEITRPEDRIKLLDFGLALKIASRKASRNASEMTSSHSTSSGAPWSPFLTAGTPEYMPPEAFDGINEFAGDIYSFGVTAYELLTGERPWEDPSLETHRLTYWRDCHRMKPPRSIREIRPDTPRWLARVVMRCLEKDPRNRIADADDLLKSMQDPAPRFLKLAVAAAFLLIALLGYYAYSKRALEPLTWEIDGRAAEKYLEGEGAILYVSSEANLQGRKVVVGLSSGKRVQHWSVTPQELQGEVLTDGRLSISFPGAISRIVGSSFSLVGNGEGVRFQGSLRIEMDEKAPLVGSLLYLDDAGASQPVSSAQRFTSGKTTFAVEAAEPHFREASLRLVGKGADRDRVIASSEEREAKPEVRLIQFPLSDLEPGGYEGLVEVVDQAGNRAESQPRVSFLIDNRAELDLTDQEGSIASKMAFFGFRVPEDESIASLSVRPEGADIKDRIDHRIFQDPQGVESRADLADLLEVGNTPLLPGGRYYLAFPLSFSIEPWRFELEVRDRSLPPNASILDLRVERPSRIERRDLERVFLEHLFQDRTQKTEVAVAGGASGALEGRIPIPLAGSLRKVLLQFRPGTVLRAEVEHPRGKRRTFKSKPDLTTLEFEAPELEENAENRLPIYLYDPLEEQLRLDLWIHPDTLAPKVESITAESPLARIEMDSSRSGWHRVRSGEEIRLTVKANEPLRKLAVSKVGDPRDSVYGEPSGDGRVFNVESLKHLDLHEGGHDLLIRFQDRVGREGSHSYRLHINSGKPRIRPSAAEEYQWMDQRLQLVNREMLHFEIEDGNGVDYDKAKFTVGLPGKSIPCVPDRRPGTLLHTIHLGRLSLPDGCDGVFRFEVPDSFGESTSVEWQFHFEYEKNWEPIVSWERLVWVHFKGTNFYVSRTEVSNAQFQREDFIDADGFYRRKDLREKFQRPRYWGVGAAFPQYTDGNGKLIKGDRFPVVGLPPEVVQAYAKDVFGPGVRLPTWEEWRQAALVDNPGGKFPWKREDEPRGRDWFNYRSAQKRATSKFHDHHHQSMVVPGKEDRPNPQATPVEVDFDPFPPGLDGTYSFPRLLHLMGNVGEHVALDADGRKYGIAGGDFNTLYSSAALGPQPREYIEEHLGANTGFRLVIPLRNSPIPPGFLKLARGKR